MRPPLLLVLLLVLPLVSCTSVADYQADCEQRFSQFPDMVACLKREVAGDPRIRKHSSADLIRLYLAYADAVAARVESGAVSDVDARLALADFYSRLKEEENERQRLESAERAKRDAELIRQGLGMLEHGTWDGQPASSPQGVSVTCFRKTDYVSGMNRICLYNCGAGGEAAITVGAAELCPLTINQ